MGRHVAGEAPELDAMVDEALRGIGADIDALRVPRLKGVVLGGGYGRGEGGAFVLPDGTLRLSNDLDFYVVAEDGTDAAGIAAIGRVLAPVSEKWSKRLGVDADFCVAKTPWRLKHDEARIMVQELVRGYFDVAGEKGERLFAGVERRAPEAIPWSEAARQLMNRGMGLLLAEENLAARGEAQNGEFVVRNLNKCILGAGDARLVARHAYRWKAPERAEALGDSLYREAVEWKFRPRAEAVCDFETARSAWLFAAEEVFEAGRRAGTLGRSLREGARWVVRRHTLGDLGSFGEDCTVRVLRRVHRHIRSRIPLNASLKRDWEVFN
ncbi:MAG: hypothetical protein ILM98_04665 [Kiritimatiellae bacterium]|nr:hypothetical protein [Kiritimatiellia bacterium]